MLYEREDCRLCAAAFRALSRLALEHPIEIARVDIERDPALRDRYALRIPVVAIDGRELDAAGLDDDALEAFLPR